MELSEYFLKYLHQQTFWVPLYENSSFYILSHFSHVWLFATLWTVTCQASLSMGFSRQEYWIGLLFPFPGDLPNPGIEPMSLMSPALAGEFFTTLTTWEAHPYQFPIFYLLYYSHSNCFIMLILFFSYYVHPVFSIKFILVCLKQFWVLFT